MLHAVRIRPPQEVFDAMIRMFADYADALKVEQWLLEAGQSGWTPEPTAFEHVVFLFAQIDSTKAEEWLSRAQQTDYRLPNTCFEAVVQAFVRAGNAPKANEWLSRMLNDERVPSDALLQDAVSLLVSSGDVAHAEAWLTQLTARPSASLEPLWRDSCLNLFGSALRSGDLACAERQLELLGDAEPTRTESVVMAHLSRGDAASAKAALERYRANGGAPTPEINLATLSSCAAAGDREGAEAMARRLAHTGNLSIAEVPVLAQVMGDVAANALFLDLCGAAERPRTEAPRDSGARKENLFDKAAPPAQAVAPAAVPSSRARVGSGGLGSARTSGSKTAAKASVRRPGYASGTISSQRGARSHGSTL